MKWPVKWLARLFAAALSLLIVLALFALLIAGSEWGLRWAYNTAAPLIPGELSIAELDGRLLGPLRVRGLHYRQQDTEIELDELNLNWSPGELFKALLHIDSLSVRGLTVHYAAGESQPDAPPIRLPDIRLPLNIRIDQAELNTLRLQARGQDSAFEITSATLSAGWDQDRGRIQKLSVVMPRYRLSATGDVTPQGDYPLDIELEWQAEIAELGRWTGAGRLHGTLDELQVQQRLTAPVQAALTGRLSAPLEALSWDANLSAPDFDLRAINRAWPELTVGGDLRSRGQLKGLETQITGTLRTAQRELRATHELDLHYGADALDITRLHSTLAGGGALTLRGRLQALSTQPRAELKGEWRGLRWPLNGAPLVQSAKGDFTLAGTQQNYALGARADITGKDIPAGQWRVRAQGTPEQIVIPELQAALLDGRLRAKGDVRWQPALQWHASWQAEGINPGRQWPDWPGALDSKGSAEGELRDGLHNVRVELPQLNGILLEQTFTASAAAALHGTDLTLSRFELRSGGNSVSASGSVAEQWDARWTISADDLAALLPEAGGGFQGGGQVSGPRDTPLLTSSLIGTHLSFKTYRAEQVQLVMSVDTAGVLPSALEVEVEKLGIDKLLFDHAFLRADGTTEQHTLQAALRGAPGRFETRLSGTYLESRWRASITQLHIEHPLSGPWSLQSPAALHAALNGAGLDDALCLRQNAASVCVEGQWDKEQGWRAQARARDLPLSLAQRALPPNALVKGEIDADAEAQAGLDGMMTGRVAVQLGDGMVSQVLSNREKSLDIAYRNGHLNAELARERLRFDLKLDLEEGGSLAAALGAERAALPAPVGGGERDLPNALSGQVQADIRDLSVLPLFVPAVENTQGQLKIDMRLAGSLAQPGLTGTIQLENGAAELPALGLRASEAQATLTALGREHFKVEASVRSGKGTLNLRGDTQRQAQDGWRTTLTVSGQDVEVIHTAEMHIIASPDMRLSLLKNRVDLEGELTIPEANIQPRELSGAVSVSDDVVIMSEEGPPAPESRWQIYSKLRIRLGDFVRFNGFGLRAKLAGEIALSDAPQQPTSAKGELRVVEGEYRAYGQELTIERGRLLFFGGPVDNPGLDVRAVRHVEDVTAGLLVRGTLKSPQVSLFSEPAMAETDALSYLLLGRPVSQATTSEGEQMQGAAAALGLFGGGFLATQLGRQFGIDDVRVESGGGFGTGAIVVRHYLSPKLYVSYGLGLFENFNVFVMRYQISKLWTLQAESGTYSSADLLYTLERD